MELTGKRFIRIGKAKIGLIGLDQALPKILKDHPASEAEAVAALFQAMREQNYFPDGLEDQYREALLQEFRRARQGETSSPGDLVIRVLGKPCVSCNRLGVMVIETLAALRIAADLEQIHDPDEIWRHGVPATPALIINGAIKSAGRLPTPAEVEQWIKEAIKP